MFRPNSNWTPPVGHPNLEMFLSELEKELFEDSNFSHFHRQNFRREEWKALRDIAEDKRIVINTFTAKGFSETRPFMHLSKHVFGSI